MHTNESELFNKFTVTLFTPYRLFILQGPSDDRLEESELSVKEMVAQRDKQKKEADLLRQAELDEAERKAEILKKREEDKGCAWGMDDDATEEDDEGSEVNPFAALGSVNEELYVDDPKKSLNGYFEREGHEPPEYEFGEASNGKWKCGSLNVWCFVVSMEQIVPTPPTLPWWVPHRSAGIIVPLRDSSGKLHWDLRAGCLVAMVSVLVNLLAHVSAGSQERDTNHRSNPAR